MSTFAATGLPPIDAAREPATVRNGSPAVQQAYARALQFENLLVQQLSQALSESSGLDGGGLGGEAEAEGGGGGDPVASQISSMLPSTLANGVMSQGGLGLASQLMGSLDPAAFASSAAPAAVTAAGGSAAGLPAASAAAAPGALTAAAPGSSTAAEPLVASSGGVAA